jgi:hypothetical protein
VAVSPPAASTSPTNWIAVSPPTPGSTPSDPNENVTTELSITGAQRPSKEAEEDIEVEQGQAEAVDADGLAKAVEDPVKAAAAAAATRKRACHELEEFQLSTRLDQYSKIKCGHMWNCLDPNKLTNPQRIHVQMHATKSMFFIGKNTHRNMPMLHRVVQWFQGCTLRNRIRPWPTQNPALCQLVVDTAQTSTDLVCAAELINDRSKSHRFYSLLRFLVGVVGTQEQRSLLAASTALKFVTTLTDTMYQHYQQSVLITTISAAASAAGVTTRAGFSGGTTSGSGSNGGHSLSKVILIMIMLRTLKQLLEDFGTKLRDAGNRSIRMSLTERLTKHVLSQDLEEVDANKAANDDVYARNKTSPQVRVFRKRKLEVALEDAIRSHACSLEALACG